MLSFNQLGTIWKRYPDGMRDTFPMCMRNVMESREFGGIDCSCRGILQNWPCSFVLNSIYRDYVEGINDIKVE